MSSNTGYGFKENKCKTPLPDISDIPNTYGLKAYFNSAPAGQTTDIVVDIPSGASISFNSIGIFATPIWDNVGGQSYVSGVTFDAYVVYTSSGAEVHVVCNNTSQTTLHNMQVNVWFIS